MPVFFMASAPGIGWQTARRHRLSGDDDDDAIASVEPADREGDLTACPEADVDMTASGTEAPEPPPPGTVESLVEQTDWLHRRTALCLMRIAHAGFPSDTRHCPMVASQSVCRTTAQWTAQCLAVDRGL